jgi:hypothetical protein
MWSFLSYLSLLVSLLLLWGRVNRSSIILEESAAISSAATLKVSQGVPVVSAHRPQPTTINSKRSEDYQAVIVPISAQPLSQLQEEPATTAAPKNIANTKSPDDVKVAYVISITGCPAANKTPTAVVDGPAVLAHSIKRLKSRYAYDLIAMVHPNAASCTSHLPLFGYQIMERELGFNHSEINNKRNYRLWVRHQGCCGEMEFLKLQAYTLVEYDVVLHLDTDLLILQPMDGIVDAMLGIDRSGIDVLHKDRPLPDDINFLFTRDYVQMSLLTNITTKFAVQGGFFALKPSARLFRRLINTVKTGDFTMKSGWNSKNYGGYYGAPQVQGLLSYFYAEHFPRGAVELNPCIYNSMVSFPAHTSTGRCRYYDDGRGAITMTNGTADNVADDATCQSCSNMSLSELHSTHYTVCFKPWICPRHKFFGQLCKDTHRAWFEMRRELEVSWGQELPTDGWNLNNTLGYCKAQRLQGYVPMKLPSNALQS